MTATFDRYAVLITNILDTYRQQLVRGIVPVLAAEGISLFVHALDPFEAGPLTTLSHLLQHSRPCGIIFTQGATAEYIEQLVSQASDLALPTVAISMAGLGRANVRIDNMASTRALMAHLFDERGVKHPAVVRGIARQKDSIERENLIKEEMAARGLVFDEGLAIDGEFEVDAAYKNMRELLRTRRDMDAVIALNDLSATGAWRALSQAGLRVPEDVLLSGFDNNDVAMMNWPGLTTIDNQLQNQGAAAAAGLVSQVLGEIPEPEFVLASRLIVRGSTGVVDQDPVEEFDSVVALARAAQRQLAEQDTLLAFNQAMMRCASTADLVEALVSTHLERLSINRCVLALYQWDDETEPGRHLSTNASRARLLLDYRNGVARPVPAESVAIYDVVHKELHDDAMVFQPLSITGRPLGYVLFNHSQELAGLPEALRIDLSRTLGAVLAADELTEYAQTLEERVEERTAELKKEVSTRRRAEAELNRLNAGLQRSLMIDGLTGISNRTAFERHFELYGPTGVGTEELALLFVDVDLFKPYNDLYGHVMGDEALRKVASCLTRAVRYPQDLACRWGGEEFAVLLPGSGPDGAMIVAERFMTLLEYARIPHAASTVTDHLTASVGLAWTVSHQGLSSTSLIKAADEALYMAKTLGRNRIHQAQPVPYPAP